MNFKILSRSVKNLLISIIKYYFHHVVLQEPVRIAGKSNPHNALLLPEKTASLRLESCHHVEIFAKTFNHAPSLRNVTITDSAKKIKLHPKMYEIGSGTSPKFNKFELINVRTYEICCDKLFLYRALHIQISQKTMIKMQILKH